MLIIALVLALIGLVALVFAVVTSNEMVAWVCIGASVLGVVLLIVDALRERQGRDTVPLEHDSETDSETEEGSESAAGDGDDAAASVDYPEEVADEGGEEPKSPESEEPASTEAGEDSAK
jgi:hypothetical protein